MADRRVQQHRRHAPPSPTKKTKTRKRRQTEQEICPRAPPEQVQKQKCGGHKSEAKDTRNRTDVKVAPLQAPEPGGRREEEHGEGDGFQTSYTLAREAADKACIVARTGVASVSKEDIPLYVNSNTNAPETPGFFVAVDRTIEAVVVAIRGTASLSDLLTGTHFVCTYTCTCMTRMCMHIL